MKVIRNKIKHIGTQKIIYTRQVINKFSTSVDNIALKAISLIIYFD